MDQMQKDEALKLAVQVTVAFANSASTKNAANVAACLEEVFNKIITLKSK